MFRTVVLAAVACSLLLLSSLLFAQSEQSSVTERVTDPAGAAVKGARVELIPGGAIVIGSAR